MGLFDDMLNQVAGAMGSAQPAPDGGAALSALGLDPAHAGLAQAVIGMLGEGHGSGGGLGGLQQQFQQAGLGDVIGSWISTGQNQPIGASQIESVLGGGMLQELAQKAGLDARQVGPILTTMLPVLIDKLTPQGQVPQHQGGLLEAGLSILRGRM
jgi:uncharacterized protein YidB (DUF937 family)